MDATAAVALVVSVVSLIGTITTVVRLFTKTEVRVDVVEERGKETAALARTTADDFVGKGQTAHIALQARVTALEATASRLATTERVDALAAEIRQGLRHLEDVIRRESRKDDDR